MPLPFGVLAQWEVGDCAGIEALIHERLAAYRVNERREFFRLPLRTIVAVINSVVEATTLDVMDLAEVTQADDFIVSNKLVSLMLSQVSENRELNALFADLSTFFRSSRIA